MRNIKGFFRLLISDSDDVSTKRMMAWLSWLFLAFIAWRGIFYTVPHEGILLYAIEVFAWLIAGLLGLTSIDKLPKGISYLREILKRKKDEPEPEPVAPVVPVPEVKPEVNILEGKLLHALPIAGHKFAKHLAEAMQDAEINTQLRMAHFLAQIHHESGGFKYTKELWGPTKAQKGYEGRKDLGNVIPGDGERFKGRGLVQVTGRANTLASSKAIYGDDRLILQPELLEQPEAAAKSAVWYWDSRNLNDVADRGGLYSNCQAVTKVINGGQNGIKDRWKQFQYYYSKLA